MTDRGPPSWIDRLQDRGLVDRYGFLFFAVAGSLVILAAKYFSAATPLVAAGAILLMLVYAIIVNMRGTGKLRSDQAGDNCYYLGLIFTLTSLAHAIFTFDPANTATTIVQGFGVALATTIFGLVLRVFFNQSRVDLFEIEETARLELSEAANELRIQLHDLSLSFKDFTVGLQQSVSEVRDEAREAIETAALGSTQAIRDLADNVLVSLESQISGLGINAAELGKKTNAIGKSMDRCLVSIEKQSLAQEKVFVSAEHLQSVAESILSTSSQIVVQAEASRAIQADAQSLVSSISQSAGQLGASTAKVSEAADKFTRTFAARLKELEDGPKHTADNALSAIARAAQEVQRAMVGVTEAQQQAIEHVGTMTGGAVKAVERHNIALEEELTRSRDNVVKVHSALVYMTGKLGDAMR